MSSALVSDTHTTIWALLDDPRLSLTAKRAMENAALSGQPIYVPSITFVEIVYLIEKGRFPQALLTRLIEVCEDPENVFCFVPLGKEIAIALQQISRVEVPDMPDRIIAATALALNLPLITRDGKIQASSITTIW